MPTLLPQTKSLLAVVLAGLWVGSSALQRTAEVESQHSRDQLSLVQVDKVAKTRLASQAQTGVKAQRSADMIADSFAQSITDKIRDELAHPNLYPVSTPEDRILGEIGEFIGNRTKLVFAAPQYSAAPTSEFISFNDTRTVQHVGMAQETTADFWINTRIQYELSQAPTVNKFQLAVINMIGFGLCGIDRCFMGQPCIGCIKCFTLGACGLWTLADALVIMFNILTFQDTIGWPGNQADHQLTMGYNAYFSEGSTVPAFVFTLIMMILISVKSGLWVFSVANAEKRGALPYSMGKV